MMDCTHYVEQVMDDVGCPKHLRGYDAAFHCIKHQLENRGENITTSYRYAGKMTGVSHLAIERVIRHMIECMLTKTNLEKIHNYFGELGPDMRITNKQFIVTLAVAAYRLRRNDNANNGR